MRNNLWIVSTLVLAVVVIVLLFFGGTGVTGEVVSEEQAAQNLLSFISAQGQGSAQLVSTEKEGALYMVTVNYQGQDLPVYVTLDGKYLITTPIPLDDSVVPTTNTNTNTGQPVDVNYGDSPKQGSEDAPVVIVEFTDYECPFCKRYFDETYSQLKKDYIDTGKVLYVVMDFPLDFHPEAKPAAEAAHCVRDQKGDAGYFTYHDKLFANQASLSDANYKKWARELGVNGATFDSCLDSGKYSALVDENLNYGQTLGVSGTPSFFINGKQLVGAQPYAAFQQIIDAELTA